MQEKCLDCKWCRIGAGTGQGAFPLECKNSKVENKESCFEADKEGECMERLTEKVYGYTQLKACGNDFCKETCAKYDEERSCDNCPIQKAIEKPADFEDLEEQGLLIRLPCKVGDYIWDNDFGKTLQL